MKAIRSTRPPTARYLWHCCRADQFQRYLAVGGLEDEGYQVDEASNGKISLELIRAATVPYVVVLDLMMPQVGGAAVLRAISQDEALSLRHAVLLVTASIYAIETALSELLQCLQIPLIRKPF